METGTYEVPMNMEAMAAMYKNLAIPGEPHRLLASLEGDWYTKSKGFMGPGLPPVEGTGSCEQKMLLDGRYLRQNYSGEMGGEAFKGINIIGYDNYLKKYVSVWMDTMSTGIYRFEGSASADGRTIMQESKYDDPVRGPMIWRTLTRIVDDTLIEFEMYMIPEGGAEEKAMEMTMTRMKH